MRPVSSCLLNIVAVPAAALIGIVGASASGSAPHAGGGRAAAHSSPLASAGGRLGVVGGRSGLAAGSVGRGGGLAAGGLTGFGISSAGSTLAFSRYGTGGSVGVFQRLGEYGRYGDYNRFAGYGGRYGGYGFGGGYGLPYGYGGYPGEAPAGTVVQVVPGSPTTIGIRESPVLPPAIYVIGGTKRRAPARTGAAPATDGKVAGLGGERGGSSVEILPSGAKIIRLAPAQN